MTHQTSIQLTKAQQAQIKALKAAGFGSFTDIVRLAVDRMYQMHQTEISKGGNDMDAELMVKVLISDSDDILAGFPFREGQFQDGAEDDETDEDCTWLRVVLGDATDTDTGQEQWLNANSRILEYTIR